MKFDFRFKEASRKIYVRFFFIFLLTVLLESFNMVTSASEGEL